MSAQGEWTEALSYSEAIAIRAFGYLASNEAELAQLLAWSGLNRGDLEGKPMWRRHLGTVLDFLVAHNATLMKFANTVDVPPESIYEARRIFGHAAQQAAD